MLASSCSDAMAGVCCRQLLEDGADMGRSACFSNANCALHMAANTGALDCLKALLSCAVVDQVNQTDKLWQTALHHAAHQGDVSKAEMLLQASADIGKADLSGWAALHFAAPKADSRMAILLLEAAADPTRVSVQGKHPLHVAASYGNLLMLQALMELTEVQVDLPEKESGVTCLMRSASSGHVKACQWLLEQGASVHARDVFEWQPLQYAAHAGRVALIQLLLAAKGDIACIEPGDGYSLLHLCLSGSGQTHCYDAVRLLLRLGLSANLRDRFLLTPKMLYQVQDGPPSSRLMELLEEYGSTEASGVKRADMVDAGMAASLAGKLGIVTTAEDY
eukprot:TRINITY_DN25782_c0_g1_i2.p1 TRINITY_DN25782_c0_g1~~TRINITY_DN25782_c0_g1_i2.p1  ORF type:complete len:335 (+),score=77.92 TRINITY_DN25782_c0_g1_i2:220-1224(+)